MQMLVCTAVDVAKPCTTAATGTKQVQNSREHDIELLFVSE